MTGGHKVGILAESNHCRYPPSLIKVNFALLELEVFPHNTLEHIPHIINDRLKVRCRIVRACDIDIIFPPVGNGGVYGRDGHEPIGLDDINIGNEMQTSVRTFRIWFPAGADQVGFHSQERKFPRWC